PIIATRIGYYVAAGVKVGSGLWSTYKARINRLTFTGDALWYGQHFEDIPRKNFITRENVFREGKTEIRMPNIAVSLETGLRYRMSRSLYVYMGVFVDYVLNSTTTAAKKAENSDNPLVSFKPVGNGNFDYAGFLNSNSTRRSSIASFHTGLKFSFTICSYKSGTGMLPPLLQEKR
ncbi:MAG: hypothetical protein LBC49_02870, partial [Bacteroidales bacterium]|nr:hypothetical protein [Bacteroidales bacterium]